MPGKPHFNADALRKLVRERMAEASSRQLAEEIGISRGGLESFLDGREPYSKTRVRLLAWYERQRHPSDTIRTEDVDAALALLNRYAQTAGTKAARERRLRALIDRLSTGDRQD